VDECKPLGGGGGSMTGAGLAPAPKLEDWRVEAGAYTLHSFPFQLNMSYSVHRITQINS